MRMRWFSIRMLPLINDFTIPRAEYDGKNGLVKLAYKAFYKFYEGETDEEVIRDFYTNVRRFCR